MADQGFHHRLPVLVLPKSNRIPVPAIMRRLNNIYCHLIGFKPLLGMPYVQETTFSSHFSTFKARCTMIERCFGVLKSSYSSAGTRCFRSRRWHGPLICNLTAALYNRRRLLLMQMRQNIGVMYMD